MYLELNRIIFRRDKLFMRRENSTCDFHMRTSHIIDKKIEL